LFDGLSADLKHAPSAARQTLGAAAGLAAFALVLTAAAPPGFRETAVEPAPPSAIPGFQKTAVIHAPPPAMPVVRAPASGPQTPPPGFQPQAEADPAATGATAAAATLAFARDGRIEGAVVISDLGLALTTASALPPAAQTFDVAFLDGRRLAARVLSINPAVNLALLQLTGVGPFVPAPLSAAPVNVGDPLKVIVPAMGRGWIAAPGEVSEHGALRAGARMDTPVLGEGWPAIDGAGRLVGIVEPSRAAPGACAALDGGADNPTLGGCASYPAPGAPPAVAQLVDADGLRGFLDRVGADAPRYALDIRSEPAGARVSIDGQVAGNTGLGAPLHIEGLAIGRHTVLLQAPGLAADSVAVELVQHGTQVLTRTLDVGGAVQISGHLGAQVWIDGALRGQAPLTLTLPSGRHDVSLRAEGFTRRAQWVEVGVGSRQSLTLTLAPARAYLSVATVPSGATVKIDGQVVGLTPLVRTAVPAGKIAIAIERPGNHRYAFGLTLAADASRDLGTYQLEAPYGWLSAQLPPDARVAVDDGPRIVPGPYERLSTGPHTLHVYAPDYYGYAEQVNVADAQTIKLDPNLALDTHLAPSRAAAYGLTGLGLALGVVSVGLATDPSSRGWVAPTLIGAAVSAGVGVLFWVLSPRTSESGWSETRTWSAPEPAAPRQGATAPAGAAEGGS